MHNNMSKYYKISLIFMSKDLEFGSLQIFQRMVVSLALRTPNFSRWVHLRHSIVLLLWKPGREVESPWHSKYLQLEWIKEKGVQCLHLRGKKGIGWILLDCGERESPLCSTIDEAQLPKTRKELAATTLTRDKSEFRFCSNFRLLS